jgi:hypothetical protein
MRLKRGLTLAFALLLQSGLFASDHYGEVTFTGLPVPGATVTATQGDKTVVATSDPIGIYKLSDLADGVWTVRVEMLGFESLSQEITVAEKSPPATFALKLLPFDEIKKVSTISAVAAVPIAAVATLTEASGPAAERPNASNTPPPAAPPADPDLERDAADGFLINGSVNNGAASPFAQPRAFGNTRTGQRSIYNGFFGINLGNSAWDARPFSFTSDRAVKPDYTDVHFTGTFGGQLRISRWRLLRNGPVFFFGFQRTADHNTSAQSALMPTAKERTGDFSETIDGFGRPVQLVDPATGHPFDNNRIPAARISPQAASLLGYYPEPNAAASGRYNYQTPIGSKTTQNSFQSRFNQTLGTRMSLNGNVAHQRTGTDSLNVFGLLDRGEGAATDASINWSRRFSQFFSLRAGYQLTRQTNRLTPHFANRTNVSSDAGITGNDQDPLNWGPPSLMFVGGMAGLNDASPLQTITQTHNISTEAVWRPRGRHTLTFGGAFRPQRYDVMSQQNPRGTFGFTGASSGFDFADFLLGLPQTSAIAFGNADKRFRAPGANAYLSDDWRLNPSLTINAGVRWEYEAPFTESQGRLVNLTVAPGFSAASPVVADSSNSLLRPDRRGIQPRLALAWRPVPASSIVVRAGYGIYRNTNVYQSIALMMAQQPPLSKTLSVETSAANPLTLANGFGVRPNVLSNTFAVDPEFRAGYAHNWQVSLQRDLPMSLTITATYLGTKGSHLMQEFVPNTYPAGAVNPCPSCPTGFVYLVSNGSSLRNAGQFQLRRRLRAGLTATAQYTFSKSTDDAASFSGADLNGAAVAQNWLDLDAEHARSSFDQRHVLTSQFEYSPRGLLNNFTFTGQLNAGSGLPLTPVYLTSLAGTGVIGTVRADYTGAPLATSQSGYYVNPAAFTIPAAGRWGSAGRNSITGPSQFGLNIGVLRTFMLNNRWSADWRVDATNILNRVTYSAIETRVGSPQFGLANRANPMRKLQSSIRLRF